MENEFGKCRLAKPFRREASGKPSFMEKKMDENSRFGELSTEEIQQIMDSAIPVTTKKAQSSGRDYLMVRIREVSLKSCKISNITDVTTTTTSTFTITFQNG